MARSPSSRRSLLVASAVGVALGSAYLAEAATYPRGALAQPGPGIYPLLVGVLLIAGALGTGVEAWRSRVVGDVAWPGAAGTGRAFAILAASLAYVLLLRYLGHPAMATLAAAVALRTMGSTNWALTVALAILFGVGSYYVFAILLGVPLPLGLWLG